MAPTSCLTLLPPTPRQAPPPSPAADRVDPPNGPTFDQQLSDARGRKADANGDAASPKKAAKRTGKAAAAAPKVATAKKPVGADEPTDASADPTEAATAAAAKAAADLAADADPHVASAEPHPGPVDASEVDPAADEAVAVEEHDSKPVAAVQPTDAAVVKAKSKPKAAKATDGGTDPAAAPAQPQASPAPAAPVRVSQPKADPTDDAAAAEVTNAAAADEPAAAPAPPAPVTTTDKPAKAAGGLGTAKVRTPGGTAAKGDDPADAASAAVAAATAAGSAAAGDDDDAAAADDDPPVAAGPVASATADALPMVGLLPATPAARAAPAGPAAAPAAATPSDDAAFTDANHPNITAAVHGQLLPSGGTLQIRLDPANLGTVQVTVHVRDGSVSASFETNNEDATRLLSHSLGELKSSLESTGITVDRMHVQQSAKPSAGDGANANGGGGRSPVTDQQQEQARQEKQRRELMQKMWQRLSGGSDPLDLVA